MENFNHYFIDTVKSKYADFTGKATRSEYWYFVLFYIIIAIVFILIDTFVVNPILGMTAEQATKGGMLQMLFALAMLIPSIAVGVRRLHDIQKSGWWMLIGFVPIVGFLVLLYFFVQKSE